MFKKYSSEQIARIVSIIFVVLALFGYKSEASEEQVVSSIDGIVIGLGLIISLGMDVFGYFRRWFKGDVTIGGRRV